MTSRVSDDYLKVFGIPVREGRTFTPSDNLEGLGVAMISEEMAQRYWPDGSD